ncbi:hypothetical protein F444_03535 [Phytophthora nicotianae P1976]|uniref:Uncharacterized protein n=1 Tax=Phytophthora nicotianae P1976 TaxID=1317066 RepID=A0A081ATU9_PHYNI|nr:hypothetical protein F444_03535 [Phytophthora nicotianae P1976]
MATKERRLLEGTIKTDPTTGTESSFKSYVEWCAELESPGFLLVTKDIIDGSKDVDTWRKLGSDFFVKSDYQAAEECYRKGMAASASCCRDVALVLNNVAAVHLMLHHEASDVPGISVGGSASDKSDHVPSTEAALLNCTVAGIIDPLNHKTWTRRARCLEKLGFKQEECIHDLNAVRASVVSKAFASAESRERVQAFKSNMSAEVERRSQISESKPAKVSDISTDTQRKERDALQPESIAAMALNNKSKAEESIDEYIARMESFEQMVRFGFAASKSKRQIKSIPREWKMFLEHPPPQIHVEFPKLRGWPEGIDPTFAQKILHRAYLDASANPWIFADTMRQGAFYEHMDPSELVKRWHGTEALEVLQSKGKFLKYGDIIDGRTSESDALPAYDARIRSNFVNNPNRAEVYFFGSTHVAIGFNDLSSLLSAKIQDKTSSSTGPLRFEGIEMSEFAVAKCKVVAQMLGSPDVSIASVMEVWLSSTWSETTLADFRKSLDTVLAAMKGTHENPKVVSYLKHWASTETISAAKARSEFFLNMERYNVKTLMAPASFCRQIDRLDLIQYMLTGEVRVSSNASNVLEKEQTGYVATNSKRKSGSKKPNRRKNSKQEAELLVGSVTMWNVPSGAPPLEEDFAFNTVDFMTLLEDFAERQRKQKHSVDRLSVADLFVIHIMKNLQRLRDLIQAHKLTINVMYGVVKAVRGKAANDPVNQELLARIAMMHPYTISWSNVLDYFLPDDFHDLARRCSMYGDCMHYGYSMNWPTQVYGASIIDYDPKYCKQVIDTTLDTALCFSTSSGPSAVPSSMQLFKMMGLDKLVTLPFREHPLNATGYVLAHVYKQHWIDHYMKTGELTGTAAFRLGASYTPSNSGLQMGTMDLSMPSPLYRTSLTLYMSWCYDPELRLQGANNPLELGAATDKDMMADMLKYLTVEERQKFWKDMGAGSTK